MWVVELGRKPDLPQKPFGTDFGRHLGTEELDGDRSGVLQVVGQIDRRHASAPELALKHVQVSQCMGQGRVNSQPASLTTVNGRCRRRLRIARRS